MNTIIATIVGAFASAVVLFTGVNAAQDDSKPVSKTDQEYTYSAQ